MSQKRLTFASQSSEELNIIIENEKNYLYDDGWALVPRRMEHSSQENSIHSNQQRRHGVHPHAVW